MNDLALRYAVPFARPLFLTGMMGTGKTALGEALARRAALPFVDLDRAIEADAAMPVARIFAERGEPAFRAIERRLLERELADPTPRVVALGGGALLDRAVRLRALERAVVVALEVEPAELSRRLAADATRPLLAGEERDERLRALLDARRAAYAEAHARLDATSRSLDDLAAEALGVAEAAPIAVALGERTYAVDVASGGAAAALARALERLAPTRVVLVTDEIVAKLALPSLEPSLAAADPRFVRVVLPPGERHKTLASLEAILRAAVEAPIDRSAVLVALGGGVVTDVGGLAAALALRGIRWIGVPTTTLAMIDASVGGKTAVDLGAAKNAVGAFHQPSRVVVDPAFATTESPRAFASGLAEVVKSALIGAPELFAELLAEGGAERLVHRRDPALLARAVRASIQVKASIVSRDERESGERAHLNLGHTLGHALEAEGAFERLTHGEAVSLGLVAALRIGERLGTTPATLARDATSVLARLGLPTALDAEPLDAALRFVAYDKKRHGADVRFVLVRAPGAVETARIALDRLGALLRP